MHKVYRQFLASHSLPEDFLTQAVANFQPIVDDVLAALTRQSSVVLAINGSQGCGKTTLAAYLQMVLNHSHGLNTVCISIDDFYYSRDKRLELASTVHPLLATRGVPGTHDIALALATIQSLISQNANEVVIPRFNKAEDKPFAEALWPRVQGPCDVVILEGWCVDAQAQDDAQLLLAVNTLEREQDADAVFRHYVNAQLRDIYPALFALADIHCMLKAPSFDVVYSWRLQQEEQLAKSMAISERLNNGACKPAPSVMSAAQIQVFIQHFQRLTEFMLQDMPDRMQHCYSLDVDRNIVSSWHKPTFI